MKNLKVLAYISEILSSPICPCIANKSFLKSASCFLTLEISIAKNYLTKGELFRLNRLVSAFFDLAEIQAQEQKQMYMKDWIAELDKFAGIYGKGILENAGKVSHAKATKKAEVEYTKYQVKKLSLVEKAYLGTIKSIQKKVDKRLSKEKNESKKTTA